MFVDAENITTTSNDMTVVKVAINKPSRRSKLGLKFAREDESRPLTISKISEGGLFYETPLIEGLVVLKINDEDVTWANPQKAESVLHKIKTGRITVTAEGVVGKISKQSRDEKLGIILHTPKASSDEVFIWKIKDHSKFAGTALKSGMKIITINGHQCPSSPTDTIRLMQRTIGKLKIVAVEVDRPRPRDRSSMQIRVEVNSQTSTGSSYDETSHVTKEIKETVSIVPSSIVNVDSYSTQSSKSSIRQRVKAMFKPLMKDEKSVGTEAMTESSSESIDKQSRRGYRNKSRKRALQQSRPEQSINFVSHGDIPDVHDPSMNYRKIIEDYKTRQNYEANLDHICKVPSSEYIPLIEGEPYEESISSTKQVIHYRSDIITINAQPYSPNEALPEEKTSYDEDSQEDLELLNIVSIADSRAQTRSSLTKVHSSLSMVDDNASLFGENISLPPDFTTDDDDSPSDEDSQVKDSATNETILLENPAPTASVKPLPPKYPILKERLKRRAEAYQNFRNNDTLKAPIRLQHEQAVLQTIGEGHESADQEDSEDQVIEEVEGDPYETEDKVSVKLELEPSQRQRNLEPVESTSPRKQSQIRRGIDPSEGCVDVEWSPRSDTKRLEPPGSRAGIKEPNGSRGRDPQLPSRSPESIHDSRVRQELPEIVTLNKPPVRTSVHPARQRVHSSHPSFRPTVSRQAHSSSEGGCSFIPQEVWDEMNSDFTSFWGRQKNYVESSWASLVAAM